MYQAYFTVTDMFILFVVFWYIYILNQILSQWLDPSFFDVLTMLNHDRFRLRRLQFNRVASTNPFVDGPPFSDSNHRARRQFASSSERSTIYLLPHNGIFWLVLLTTVPQSNAQICKKIVDEAGIRTLTHPLLSLFDLELRPRPLDHPGGATSIIQFL